MIKVLPCIKQKHFLKEKTDPDWLLFMPADRQTRRTDRRPTGDTRERTNGQKRMELLSVILLLVSNPVETQIQIQIHTHKKACVLDLC